MGGWHWGGTDDAVSIDTVRAGVDVGVTSIDTAPVYGFGRSERVVGEAIRPIRAQVQVLTKVGLRWDCEEGAHFFDTKDASGDTVRIFRNLRPASIRWEVEQSLERLGVDHIDLIQCHWPDPSTPISESMGALADLVREGKAGAVGVSNFSSAQLSEAQESLGSIPLASNQPGYSLIDRRIERGVLPWCRDHGVGVMVYSPLAGGLLTGKIAVDREFPQSDGRHDDPRYDPVNRQRVLDALSQVQTIAASREISLANLAVAWVLHRSGVTAALVGARTPEQARENAKAGSVVLTESDLSVLDEVFGTLRLLRRGET